MNIQSVPIKLIDPNPERDLEINPIMDTEVDMLINSINATKVGFQGALLARTTPSGRYELAWGHTRLAAMKKMGKTHVALDVRDKITRADMVRTMAWENHTQKGGKSAATADSVAAAVKTIYGEALRFSGIPENSDAHYKAKAGHIGEPAITAFLNGEKSLFTSDEVRTALAGLKKTGDYDRIVAAELADYDAEVAAKSPESRIRTIAPRPAPKSSEVTLDRRVLKLTNNDAQARVVQQFVSRPEVKAALPVNQQYDLISSVVKTARTLDGEISARQLKEDLDSALTAALDKVTHKTKEEKQTAQAAKESAVIVSARNDAGLVRDYLNSFVSYTARLEKAYQKHPGLVLGAVKSQLPKIAGHMERLPDAVKFLKTIIKDAS